MRRRLAVVSIFDKRGVDEFARKLMQSGFEIVSSGGTYRFLREKGVETTEVSSLTGFPEMFDGRVKTLHPVIHAGILARRDFEGDIKTLDEHDISPIDVVVCNLYPFEDTISKKDVSLEEVVENIDIGGPTLVRSAAKNFEYVTVVVNPDKYEVVADEIEKNGAVSRETRVALAVEAFEHVARYDAVIANYLRKRLVGEKFPGNLTLAFELIQKTRYGENPHQEGAVYRSVPAVDGASIINSRKLQGKELSYNNILDADCAVDCVKEFMDPTAVIVKHATPCGIACADSVLKAWEDAYATDTYSPFGGVVAFNREVDSALSDVLSKFFLEVVVAPSFSDDSLEILGRKKNLRLLELPNLLSFKIGEELVYRSVGGGLLIQDKDVKEIISDGWRVVTKNKPSEDELKSMVFAVKCVRHVRSNAVVFVNGTKTVGIGGGQTARVDASWIATHKGGERIKGSVMASDAFFPFRDAVDVAAKAGVRAIVQPGGSIRDQEVIDAANEYGIPMVFTGQRYFRH
ncbi:MAG: bifunctional phosphoribosylaminoimidazolecarboxamide formyltransferase/inosine monophosphate cyclohydrolase [Thermoplasmata archaeon]|nr:MAG: bifunctional phosphoribosylaminoimidazolecarboxamide formyltransferase/inosine monophosphate cyclohydrolase [Thermoplasmata archaeon]